MSNFKEKVWKNDGQDGADVTNSVVSADNMNDLEGRIKGGFASTISARKQTWGTSLSFAMLVGQQALVLVNSSVLILIWHSGGGYTHNVVSANTIDYTIETQDTNITINFETQVTATAFLF